MTRQLFRLVSILVSVILLSSFTVFLMTDSFATSATHENIDSDIDDTIDFRTITNQGIADDVPDAVLSLDKEFYSPGEGATATITDVNADVTSGAIDFITATVDASSFTLTESAVNSGIFTGTFTVGTTAPSVDYTPDPKNAARVKVVLPSGFTGDLTFSDSIVTDNEAFNSDFFPVTGALKITGTLNVEPEIFISYTNANFTGVTAGNDATDLRMYYKAPGEAYEEITLPASVDDVFFTITLDTSTKTIKSKNSDDPAGDNGAGGGSDPGILIPGGFNGRTDYQGEYVLAVKTGAGGGGGGGLVSPGLVVNALAGIGGFGGGGSGASAPLLMIQQLISSPVIDVPQEVEQMIVNQDSSVPIPPMDPNSFDDFDFPLVINDNGFVLGGFSNTLQTQTLKTDTPVTMKFTVYTGTKIQHFSLYTNLRDTNDSIAKSDTQILYNDGKELQVIDKNGFFSDAKITILDEEDSIKKYVIVEMTFAKEMDTSHIITRMWDPNLASRDTHILDAIKVESPEPEFIPIPQATEEVQVEELKSQTIPKWVKNNAEWWVDQQIGDEDFVAGIQYMVNNGIMYIPNTEPVNSSVTEIPDWIKTNAQWWVDNQISDDDFVQAMEWLVTNGVLRIE